jgi:hypothetical protein
MKTTDLWYETLPGRSPAAVVPPRGYAWTAVGPGAIPVLELMGLQSPAEIRNLTPGIHTPVETFFGDIAPGAATVAGGEAPKNIHENQDITRIIEPEIMALVKSWMLLQ